MRLIAVALRRGEAFVAVAHVERSVEVTRDQAQLRRTPS